MKPNTQKHTNFTVEEIEKYLGDIKILTVQRKYIISQNKNRLENIEFIEEYNINTKKIKEMITNLHYSDFCYAADNVKEKFKDEKLYVFSKCFELDNWGEHKMVDVYFKFNKTSINEKDDFFIIISFHKRNKDVTYLFK